MLLSSQSKDQPVASIAALDVAMPELGSVVVSHRRGDPGALVGALVGVLVGAFDGAPVSHWKLTE